jgi:hypothetical protein
MRTYRAIFVIAVVFGAACGSATPTDSPSVSRAPEATLVAIPTQTPILTPTPIPIAAGDVVKIQGLPRIEFDARSPLVVCDPDPSQASVDAGETTLPCIDGTTLAVRVLASLSDEPIHRLYLRRPPCSATPCTRDQLDTAIATGWFADGSMTVAMDSRLDWVLVTTDDPAAMWPMAGSSDLPSSAPIDVKNAPREIRLRDRYPSCGQDDIAVEPVGSADACFLGAVLRGRPAEYLLYVYGTEGGQFTWFYRFDGDGPVIRYRTDDKSRWFREAGEIILNPPGGASWSYDPWWGTDARV